MASGGRLAEQGSVRGGKRWAKTPRIAARSAPRSRCWSMLRAVRWGWRSRTRTSPTARCCVRRSRPSWSSGPDPHRSIRNTSPLSGQGYDNPTGRAATVDARYTPHIRRIVEEKKPCDRAKGEKPRRWVVERTLGWLSKCRGILVRYGKKDNNYLGLIQLACALCWYRRLYRMGRCNANRSPT